MSIYTYDRFNGLDTYPRLSGATFCGHQNTTLVSIKERKERNIIERKKDKNTINRKILANLFGVGFIWVLFMMNH